MKMRMPWFIIYLAVVAALAVMSSTAHAWNPITDVRDNLQWTFGKKAEVGEAVKLWGAGDLASGETATSMLAGIADYRFLAFSYGGTRVNRNDANFTDTMKIGFRLTDFFDLFKNPPTAEMQFMRNLNVGPSLAMPIISKAHPVAVFLDINYSFGGSSPVPAQ